MPRVPAFVRRPAFWVFGGILALWVGLYFKVELQHRGNAPANGTYYPIRARGDGHYVYLNLLSLVYDRDLDLTNQYRTFGDPFNNAPTIQPTGKPWIYPVGSAVLEIPAFVAAHGAALVANGFGARIARHGYTHFHQTITYLAALLAGFFAVYLGYRLARRHVSETAALWGAVAVGLGTAVHYYSVYSGSYSHAWSALAVALFVEAWDRTRGRHDARRYALCGAFAGLAMLTRSQEILWGALLAAEAAVEAVRRARRRDTGGLLRLAGYGALALACAAVTASPQILADRAVFGEFFPVPMGEHFLRPGSPFFWEVLFGPRNGMFTWTPVAYLGALGLFLAPHRARFLAAGLAAGFLAQLWVNGSAWAWWADWSFSARRMLGVTAALVAGAAFAIERLRELHARYPRLAPNLAVALVLLPFVGMNLELSCAVPQKQKVNVGAASTSLVASSWTRLLDRVRGRVGDPFALPASLVWGARHDVHPRRYEMVGDAKLFIDHKNFRKPGYRAIDRVRLDEGGRRRFGAGPWGASGTEAGRPVTWARSGARVLVPLHLWEGVRFVVHAAPAAPGVEVAIRVNGGHRATFTPEAGLQPLEVRVPDGALHPGTNELEVTCATDTERGCLAVEQVELIYEVPR